MNFSDQWRSLWPVSSVFAAPNLLTGPSSKPMGPLLFHPIHPPLPLLSSPSLALHFQPSLTPSSLRDGVNAFFRCKTNEAFLSQADQDSLVAETLSSLPAVDPDPIPSNNLHALRCRDPSTVVFFFPTGDNNDCIGYLSVSFKGPAPEIRVDSDGDVFKQREGFKHSHHRILKISVVPASEMDFAGNSVVEGFLIAATMYSVNWFRVETRVSDSGQERPFLVPLVNRGFESCIVHACWSPHLSEECAALSESGELFWFNLDTKKGCRIMVTVGGDDPGGWLSCEFGGQPWIVIVACSVAVVLVDLRSPKGTMPKVLARINVPDWLGGDNLMENDRYLAFCRTEFDYFHFSVVTEHRLFLFDIRQPMVPVLMWDHSIEHPTYVSMFRLSELRPSEEFKWASESGFAILVGSFWNDEFSLFCYGPKERAVFGNSLLYAWELPWAISLSGRQCGSGDNFVREEFSKENLPNGIVWQQRKDIVAGFCVFPEDLLKLKSEPGGVNGFALIRLMLSGKLELQRYHTSLDLFTEKFNRKEEPKGPLICCWGRETRVSDCKTRYCFLKFSYLFEYMKGNLLDALRMHNSQLSHKETNQISFKHDLKELISNNLKSGSLSVSNVISDFSFPASIFEIASRRVLAGLGLDLLYLAFSQYAELFGDSRGSSFEFLEVPSPLPQNRLPPFFVGKPSRRSEKWSKKAPPGEGLVGPVLPVSVLLTLQQMVGEKKSTSFLKEKADDDLLTLQCKEVLDRVLPAISIADTELQDEMPFFVYEPLPHLGSKSTCNGTSFTATHSKEEELPQRDHIAQTSSLLEAVPKDEKFSTLVCGINEKLCCSNSGENVAGFEIFDDLIPIKLDFDSSSMSFQPYEQKIYKGLKRQFSKWLGDNKPYENFCNLSKIPKRTQ